MVAGLAGAVSLPVLFSWLWLWLWWWWKVGVIAGVALAH